VVKDIDFTVITPVYNGERYIKETIESVLNLAATFKFEYLVINDGSTDSTLEIIQKFENRIQIINQRNMGESAAVNHGIKLAAGRYILVVSADDPVLSKDLFSMALEILDNAPSIIVVYPDWQIIDAGGKVVKKIQTDEYSTKTLIGLNKTIPGPGAIFRKDMALKIGGRSSRWKYVGDYDFWIRLSMLGDFKRIPTVLAQWRSHAESTSTRCRNLEMATERIKVIEEFIFKYGIDKQIERMALGNAYYLAARLCFFDSKIPGRKWFIQSIKLRKCIPEQSSIFHALFLLTFPLSFKIFNLIRKF
jgi:glycosyltransferase involved in cell wall biosynthesis